ncbi:coiled-coil domain-containing protein [Enterococcus innesii]|nr:hypothetical protein [Enterococcus innesii]
MSIFTGSTEMLRKVKEEIEKAASGVKEKLLGIIEDAKNEQEEVNSNLKQAIDREAARNDVQDEKIEDHERKIHLTQQELNFFKEDQAEINKSLDSAIVAEKERNDQQDETLKQHSEAIEKNTADILENADKAHQDLEAHKEESAAKFDDLSQKVDTNTQNIKQTREELQEQLGEHDNRITENKNQIAANAEKAERAIESAVLDLKKSILETNKDVMQNATNINLISENVDKKIEGQNLRIEAIEDLLDELIKEVKEEFKVLHDNTTLNSEQISKLNQSVTEINSLVEKLELDTKENTENINLIFEVLADLENIREETSAEIDSKLEALLLGELSSQSHNLDYKNKVSGSIELNPNVGRRGALRPDPSLSQSVGIGEMTQAQYDVLSENDGKTFTAQSAITFQASYGATFVFDVVENFKKTYPKLLEFLEAQSFEDVIQVIEKFVKNQKIIVNAAGYAGTDRGMTIAWFNPDTKTWETTEEHTEATPQKLSTNVAVIKNETGNTSDLNGKAICIIRSPESSQSVQQGIALGRYVNIILQDKEMFSYSPFMPAVVIMADEPVETNFITDVEIDNESVVNERGVAKIPYSEDTAKAVAEVFGDELTTDQFVKLALEMMANDKGKEENADDPDGEEPETETKEEAPSNTDAEEPPKKASVAKKNKK